MDVTRILEADHRTVEDLFEQIADAEGGARTALIEQLTTALRGHMELEETTVYPPIQPIVGQEAVQEGETEHRLARTALEQMLELAPEEPGFEAALEALKAGVQHHVEEEEGQVFPKVRKEGQNVLSEIATPFMTTRMQLGLPMEAAALSSAFSKDELVEEASKAGVDATSSMTKDEIAKALAGVMS